MYPTAFGYSAPASLDDVLTLLAEHGEGAKLLAGGHSLIPLMKLRFAQPSYLVDLGRVAGMKGIARSADALTIGAMTTHNEIATSTDVAEALPMLADATRQIGDPHVRNRGTIGGSLAHADPGADLPAVMIAGEAEMTIVGRGGKRVVGADQFFLGMLETALAPDEVLTSVRIPLSPMSRGSAYVKRPHPASRYALIGVAAAVRVGSGGKIESARIGITGMGARAVRAAAAEKLLVGTTGNDETLRAAAASVADGVDPHDDLQGDVAYKRQLAAVFTTRALAAALRRATA
jgi:carbon-monoxide dehydrogenase medium subunit